MTPDPTGSGGSTAPVEALLIEDNPGDVDLLKQALGECRVPFTTHVAVNAVEAFWFLSQREKFAGAKRPDVIVVDLNLPVISGHELIATLKSRAEWRDIPVVVLTSSNLEYDRARALKAGVSTYQIKPKTWAECQALARTFALYARRGFASCPVDGATDAMSDAARPAAPGSGSDSARRRTSQAGAASTESSVRRRTPPPAAPAPRPRDAG